MDDYGSTQRRPITTRYGDAACRRSQNPRNILRMVSGGRTCLCHFLECAVVVTICVLLALQAPPWSPKQQEEIYRKYHCVAQRFTVKTSHVREAERQSDVLEKELLISRSELEKAKNKISMLKVKQQSSGYSEVAICLAGKEIVHASKLEARGELYDRVPKRFLGQIETVLKRAYYEMRAKDCSEPERKVLEKVDCAPALDGEDGK